MRREVEGRWPVVGLEPLISMAQIPALCGYSRASVYRLIAQGRFPRPLRLGPGRIAFLAEDLRKWRADPTNYRAAE